MYWEIILVSVETNWNRQATGFPLGDTQTHGWARYHMDQNHLETALKIQVTRP